ncbi:YkgJ family cysteine cluster protein [Botrimarina hoheduenensis]|uniref:Flagellin N-methylase n=1 Tax=Botrimarina hoheduenensis TaxID=2528000 RepID=A0A5C5WF26_9BACT|nr:YkgJ family cysteine cluster protein [Botrimarina hoheduenensis]TWT48701.1 Flagellin N-methylase [Botrimarina hoheduenensis]
MAQPSPDEWMADGLRFTCTGCGDCCAGAEGYVWVNKQEIAALAEQRGMTVEAFEAEHVRKVGVRKSLTERADGDCVLLDPKTRKCTAYNARPRQCRTWPFWESTVKSPAAWAETCEACPGAGVGKLYTLEEIRRERAVIRV